MRTLFLAVLLALTGAGAFAHGDQVHIGGIITSVSATAVSIKTADGKTTEVKLVKNTVFIRRVQNSDQPATASDLSVGAKVFVHARPVGNTLEASEVKFSMPDKAATTSPSTKGLL
ncbi:MAG TPA: hypothetical protein VE545_01200 [Candidatus Dormibacteraeota bacterium]|jgi:hypothetical protein|nr:hypothetical protein [Candidatus Dormibacteraeota bacterium]